MKDNNHIENMLKNMGSENTPERIDELAERTVQQFRNNLSKSQS